MTVEVLNSVEARDLAAAIQTSRQTGKVTVGLARHTFQAPSPGAAIAAAKVFAVHFFGTEPHLERVASLTTDEAMSQGASWLSTSLVCRLPCMPVERAREHLRSFFAWFHQPHCFTNRMRGGGTAISESTFNAALVVVDKTSAGMLCVEEED
jgi:hypothetical protein